MTDRMRDFIRALVQCGDIEGGAVLDVGSYIEAGQEHLDLRQAFTSKTSQYIGIDVQSGPGVDWQVDFCDDAQVDALLSEMSFKIVVCLYVLEHVWDIRRAARALVRIWRRQPGAWLIASTHQCQPYHGTDKYPDYWRITHEGMRRLFSEAGVTARIVTYPDAENPSDVMAICPPADLPWPSDLIERVRDTTGAPWYEVTT